MILYLWDMCGTLFYEKWDQEKTGFNDDKAWIADKYKRELSPREYEELWEVFIKKDYLNLDIMPGFKEALELGEHNEVFSTGVVETNDWRAEFLESKIGYDFRPYFQKTYSTFDYSEKNIKTREMLISYLIDKYKEGYRKIVFADDKLENIKEFVEAIKKIQKNHQNFSYRAYHILNNDSVLKKKKDYYSVGNLFDLIDNEKNENK